MGRLDDLKLGRVDFAMTLAAIGYRPEGLISDKVLPLLPVSEGGARLPKYSVDMLQVQDDLRALRAAPKQMSWTPTYVDVTLEEHAVDFPLDWREVRASLVAKIDAQARATKSAKRMVLLGREKAVADLLTKPSTYAAGHSETVGAGSGWNEKTDGTSNVDVISVIVEKSEFIRSKIGLRPNVFWCGAKAWSAIMGNTKVLDRMAFAPAAISASRVTMEAFAQAIGVEKVLVGGAVYSPDGSTLGDIWGDAAGIAFVEQAPSEVESPTFGFLAIEQFQVGSDQTYGYVRSWEENPFVTHYAYVELYKPWIALNTAGYLWLDTVK